MKEPITVEKRNFQRFNKSFLVIFKNRSIDHFITGYSENISLGGICLLVENDSNLEIGQVIRLQFQMEKDNEVFEIDGDIKWIETTEKEGYVKLGIEFTIEHNPHLEEIRQKITNYLK